MANALASYKLKKDTTSAVVYPTTVNVSHSRHLTGEETLEILTEFIKQNSEVEESLGGDNLLTEEAVSAAKLSPMVLNQLRRIQRDLRGLPPLLTQSTGGSDVSRGDSAGSGAASDGETLGDGDVEMEIAEEVSTEAREQKLSKEERKRLKKERMKEAKRNKKEQQMSKAEQDSGDEGKE